MTRGDVLALAVATALWVAPFAAMSVIGAWVAWWSRRYERREFRAIVERERWQAALRPTERA